MKSKGWGQPGYPLSFSWPKRWDIVRIWRGVRPEDLVDQADLPQTIKQVICRVVQGSRLWRQEKIEVASELLAHFEDGLCGGKDAENLIRDFGDPKIAAKLIRSGKIRNRSMNAKLLYGGIWGFLAFVLSYFGLTAFYHAGKANPGHDYLADFNAPALSVSPEQAAWPIYREPFTKFGFSEGGGGRFEEIYLKREAAPSTLVTPDDGAAWTKAISKLEESAELLDAFRAARMKTHFGLPLFVDPKGYSDEDFAALYPKRTRDDNFQYDWSSSANAEIVNQSMISILLPHYQVFRTATRILIVDTRWAIEQGDFDRATENLEAIFGFSHQLGNEIVLVGDLVGYAIQSLGFDLIDELFPEQLDQFSDDQLARMQAAVTKSDPIQMVDLDGEKYMILDIFQRCFTDDGKGDGRITPQGYQLIVHYGDLWNSQHQSEQSNLGQSLLKSWDSFTAPFAVIQFPSRKESERTYLELLEKGEQALRKPYYAATSFEFEKSPLFETNQFLNSLFPAIQQVAAAAFRTKGQQAATATAIAIYRYQKKYGSLPSSLNDLLETYLEQLPVDQFDGQSLRYRKQDEGFLLYSIGHDGTDNGGQRKMIPADSADDGTLSQERPQPTGEYQMSGDEKDLDWVLWPRMGQNGN